MSIPDLHRKAAFYDQDVTEWSLRIGSQSFDGTTCREEVMYDLQDTRRQWMRHRRPIEVGMCVRSERVLYSTFDYQDTLKTQIGRIYSAFAVDPSPVVRLWDRLVGLPIALCYHELEPGKRTGLYVAEHVEDEDVYWTSGCYHLRSLLIPRAVLTVAPQFFHFLLGQLRQAVWIYATATEQHFLIGSDEEVAHAIDTCDRKAAAALYSQIVPNLMDFLYGHYVPGMDEGYEEPTNMALLAYHGLSAVYNGWRPVNTEWDGRMPPLFWGMGSLAFRKSADLVRPDWAPGELLPTK